MSTKLRAEIKQRTPFRCAEEEAFLNLMKTAAVLDHAAESRFKEHGLTMTQYNALRILRGAGAEGLCRNELSKRLIRPVSDATRLLDRMVASGWVERERGGEDRRFVTARITKAGLDLLAALDDEVTGMHRSQLGHMSSQELERLSKLLEKVRAHE